MVKMPRSDEKLPRRDAIEFEVDIGPLSPPPSFLAQAQSFGLAFDAGDLERLGRYLALLLTANEKLNLTGIREADEAWIRHIFDSLTLLPMLGECAPGASVVDVGSGGGTPGIPLAIAQSALAFTLVESTQKKAEFLRAAVGALDVKNVTVVCARAETIGAEGGSHRERFDAAIARALGPLNVAAELVLPLIAPGGQALFIKGQKAANELVDARRAIHTLGGVHAGTVQTPTGRIVVLEKARPSPRAYPRKPGVPKKEPIG